ncbi:MAG: acylphosphatase [Bacteroidetes bacterium]|nr:acylphosphatase [Bacteroidota bacterium]
MQRHYNIEVEGKVQGVYYRATAMQVAGILGITGYAQNLPDGKVKIEAEGDEDMLVRFIQWCHHGPEGADVKHVSVTDGAIQSFKVFEIRR